ncbi:YeeE/YedE thiosulfate transporter family protein [Fuchsiella alkaliacetigena]|uniref:YeeE/YedE thiosulfate transporter family protein n=1 Tax=Fuchsiella alkaliacetigena TaxID=957042 RepID=UPI00200AC71C|nr:YeeE/YedE thiosulfate transporter family protein [Fuchsiella alkaliacetigena]MCK8825465.1 YeeE/YedE family protein [Fuchsiella alkaliacetigena]
MIKQTNKSSFWRSNWSYYFGGAILGLINIIFIFLLDTPLGVISFFYLVGRSGLSIFSSGSLNGIVVDEYIVSMTVIAVGVVFGSFLSGFLSKQFRLRKKFSYRRGLSALLGGIFMGYGAYIAGGCNIGAMVGGIASFSLHGWIFAIFMCTGVYVGGRLIKLIA